MSSYTIENVVERKKEEAGQVGKNRPVENT
jgi:hypothetical protein